MHDLRGFAELQRQQEAGKVVMPVWFSDLMGLPMPGPRASAGAI